jgi:hypothetical protein
LAKEREGHCPFPILPNQGDSLKTIVLARLFGKISQEEWENEKPLRYVGVMQITMFFDN